MGTRHPYRHGVIVLALIAFLTAQDGAQGTEPFTAWSNYPTFHLMRQADPDPFSNLIWRAAQRYNVSRGERDTPRIAGVISADAYGGVTNISISVTGIVDGVTNIYPFIVKKPITTNVSYYWNMTRVPNAGVTNPLAPLLWSTNYSYSAGGSSGVEVCHFQDVPFATFRIVDYCLWYSFDDSASERSAANFFVQPGIDVDTWFQREYVDPAGETNFPQAPPEMSLAKICIDEEFGFATNYYRGPAYWGELINHTPEWMTNQAGSGDFTRDGYFTIRPGTNRVLIAEARLGRRAVSTDAVGVVTYTNAWSTNVWAGPIGFAGDAEFFSWYNDPGDVRIQAVSGDTNAPAPDHYQVTIGGSWREYTEGDIGPTSNYFETVVVTGSVPVSPYQKLTNFAVLTDAGNSTNNVGDVIQVWKRMIPRYDGSAIGLDPARDGVWLLSDMMLERDVAVTALGSNTWRAGVVETNLGSNVGTWEGEGWSWADVTTNWAKISDSPAGPYARLRSSPEPTPWSLVYSNDWKRTLNVTNDAGLAWSWSWNISFSGNFTVTNTWSVPVTRDWEVAGLPMDGPLSTNKGSVTVPGYGVQVIPWSISGVVKYQAGQWPGPIYIAAIGSADSPLSYGHAVITGSSITYREAYKQAARAARHHGARIDVAQSSVRGINEEYQAERVTFCFPGVLETLNDKNTNNLAEMRVTGSGFPAIDMKPTRYRVFGTVDGPAYLPEFNYSGFVVSPVVPYNGTTGEWYLYINYGVPICIHEWNFDD